jgi:hypothetical protein
MNFGSAIKRSPFVPLFALLLVMPNLRAQGLGGVSRCDQAPQIAASAASFALQNNTGLNSQQASAVVTTVVRQASQSAPYLADAICTAALNSIQQTVLQTASQGQTPQGNLSRNEVATLPPEEAVATPDGYREMSKAVVKGAIEGAVSARMGTEGLQQLIAAVTISIVKDAAMQASSQNGTTDPTHGLPMDNVEEAKAMTTALVATIVQVALRAGFSDKQVSTAIDRAAAQCADAAQNIGSTIQNGAPGSVATEVASQVAGQVAAEVQNQVDTKIQLGAQDPEAVTDTLSTPGVGTRDTLPTAPGQAIIPGVNVPPQSLSSQPTSNPTPVSTPTPASPR